MYGRWALQPLNWQYPNFHTLCKRGMHLTRNVCNLVEWAWIGSFVWSYDVDTLLQPLVVHICNFSTRCAVDDDRIQRGLHLQLSCELRHICHFSLCRKQVPPFGQIQASKQSKDPHHKTQNSFCKLHPNANCKFTWYNIELCIDRSRAMYPELHLKLFIMCINVQLEIYKIM